MNSTDKLKTNRQIQRALRKNPNDIDALLQVANMLGARQKPDLAQKRKVLHHILSLEPTHRKARTMLFEMDRAEIGGNPSRLSAAVILIDPSKNNIAEKPLILRYSLIHQILVYLFIVLTVLISLRIRQPEVFAVFGVFLLFLLIPLWFVSVVVEITDTGLKVSHLFGAAHWEIPWTEIKAFKRDALGKGIKIITHKGKITGISSQIIGYSAVVEILRQMQPDLFDLTDFTKACDAQDSSSIPLDTAKPFKEEEQAYN